MSQEPQKIVDPVTITTSTNTLKTQEPQIIIEPVNVTPTTTTLKKDETLSNV